MVGQTFNLQLSIAAEGLQDSRIRGGATHSFSFSFSF
jgi:hypothetical protein